MENLAFILHTHTKLINGVVGKLNFISICFGKHTNPSKDKSHTKQVNIKDYH